TVQRHVGLTHRSSEVLDAATAFARILLSVESGLPLREAILRQGTHWISEKKVIRWSQEPDTVIIGNVLSCACYIQDAFPAALFLCWKYAEDFRSGIIANAHVGGDNCHRGAVVGALLGLANGVGHEFLEKLKVRPQEQPQAHRSQGHATHATPHASD
ncbi:MAG: hypothetical protein RLZZ399_2543, partial [Verrucomicrobiota bacterium]